MLSTLYLLVAAMAFMPLLIQAPEPNHRQYFANVPKTVNKTTFPMDLKVNRTSDMVFVKCPGRKYHHRIESDDFTVHDTISDAKFKIIGEKNITIWVPLMKTSSRPERTNCGRLGVNSGGDSYIKYDWIYNVNFKGTLNAKDITVKEKIVNTVEVDHEKCIANGGNTLIFTKKKEGGIMSVKPYPTELESPYVYQMFYYFKIPSENNNYIIEEPCGIYKAYSDSPQIIIPSHETFSNTEESGKIITISIEGAQGAEKNFTVQLQLKDNPNFYRGEKISLTKMRYLEGGPNLINNSKSIITSKFNIKGFELIQMQYVHEGKTNKETITKKYFFGPSSIEMKLDNVTVPYVKGDKYGQPNCSNYFMTIGYLEEIVYNREKYVKGASSTNEKFKKSEDFYFLKENSERKIFLECIYRTPGGKITTRTNFVVKESEKKIETSSNLNINIYNAYNLLLVSSLFIMILRYF
uniref:6-cysteine protein n=1 Tax=Strongyloides papillosus TaxID=174720 RepID=A0A0N5BTF8_STREA